MLEGFTPEHDFQKVISSSWRFHYASPELKPTLGEKLDEIVIDTEDEAYRSSHAGFNKMSEWLEYHPKCELSENVLVERLWRSIKYERVYLRDYVSVSTPRVDIVQNIAWYNREWDHSGLAGKTTEQIGLSCLPCLKAGE